MTTRLIRDDISTFRMRRAVASNLTSQPDVHPLVKFHLEELNTLLGKAVFPAPKPGGGAPAVGVAAVPAAAGGAGAGGPAAAPGGAAPSGAAPPSVAPPSGAAAPAAAPAAGPPAMAAPTGRLGKRSRNGHGQSDPFHSPAMHAFLERPLQPKFIPKSGNKDWELGSLALFLHETPEAATNRTLEDLIDRCPEIAQLKYAFLDHLQDDWTGVSANARTVLQNYPNIRDYLLAYAFVIQEVTEDDAVRNLIVNHKDFVRRIVGYAAASAARTHIDSRQLRVENYNDNASDFIKKVLAADLYVTSTGFDKGIQALIDDFIFDRDEESILDNLAKTPIGAIPAAVKPLLIKLMQNSPIPITDANSQIYVPHLYLQALRMQGAPDPASQVIELPTDDFRVRFEDNTDFSLEISTPAVLCAAQTYHSMVLGEELDVFGAITFLTTRRLVMGGGVRFKDARLRRDLQDYVFDNEFEDTLTHERMNRTRPAERQMFYRQVFNYGDATAPDEMAYNSEFDQLWKVLMIESARYLERAQASLHPDSFVSGQGVMQAVEDLQYNLSTSCTGMATVIAPITDAELNFVLARILMHEEIVRFICPEGGSWKNVVDALNSEQHRTQRSNESRSMPTCNAATLYNKARQGTEIIEAIATYVPGDFDNLGKLSAFIGLVDAFITTNSILQRKYRLRSPPRPALEEDEHEGQEPQGYAEDGDYPSAEPAPAAAGSEEWDF